MFIVAVVFLVFDLFTAGNFIDFVKWSFFAFVAGNVGEHYMDKK